MGALRFTLGYPKFNGSHFGLPPASCTDLNDRPGLQNGVNYDVFAQAQVSTRSAHEKCEKTELRRAFPITPRRR